MKSMHQPVIVSAVQTPLGSFAITEALRRQAWFQIRVQAFHLSRLHRQHEPAHYPPPQSVLRADLRRLSSWLVASTIDQPRQALESIASSRLATGQDMPEETCIRSTREIS